MKARLILELVALVVLPVVVLGAIVFLGDGVDPCLAPSPMCGAHQRVSPWPVVAPGVILWLVALIDLARSRDRR